MDSTHIWELDCRTMSWVTEPLSRRQVMGRGVTALAGVTLLGSLFGCGDDESTATAGDSGGALPGEGKTIALSLNGFNTYDQNQAEGVLKALDGTGYKLIGAEAGFDATREVANIKQLIARQPAGMIVLAASADGAARACKEAKDLGIPVVTNLWFPISKEVDSVYYAATQVEGDESGKLAVDFITGPAGVKSGKILEITGLDAQPLTESYKQGIRKALEAHPDLEVVASQQGLYTADGALKVLRPMLSAHPDAKVIIDYAAEMGVAIAQELERQGRKDIVHITSDGNDRMVPWLEKADGAYLAADRWFSPADEGVAGVNMLRAKLEQDAAPTEENLGLEGWKIVPGTSDPIVVSTRQAIATADNIGQLPPMSATKYTSKIPFGA